MTHLPTTRKKTKSAKIRSAKRSSAKGTRTHRKVTRLGRSRATKHGVRKSKTRGTAGETYVFECTRQDCGYKIVREEKAEPGELRYDLKCPKCHNSEFKCLGKGDLPVALELAIPMSTIDFDNINPLHLGSN